MSISNVRGGLSQSEASIVVKATGGAGQLTITHPATNGSAVTATLPANDADYLVIPNLHGGDTTKIIDFNSSGATTGVTLTISSVATVARTLTLPDATDTLVGKATTDILTNKTLTAPLITTGGSIDVTGAGSLTIAASAGANTITIGGATSTVAIPGTLSLTGGFNLPDTDDSHSLVLLWNENEASANRTLNLVMNGADRTVNLTGNLTLAANLTTTTGAITLAGDAGGSSLTLPASGTVAVTSDKLSVFAATTSAELAGVISDETGSGALVFATSPTLTTPVITTGGSIDVSGAGTLSIAASAGANNITIGGATSTVVIAGNLQVDGTTTTVNSTTLDVTDANITINNGGNQASADGTAGLTVEMSDATDTKILYDSTLTSRFKVGDSGSESEIITAAGAQTITAVKTFSANPVISQITNTGTVTLPTATTTLVGTDTTDTLTNKTLSDGTKYNFQNVTIASNTFAKPATTVARITSGTDPLYTISGASNGDLLVIENKTGAAITIVNENASGGFTTGTGGDLTLADDASLTLIYNSTDTYWSVIGGSGSGSGSGEINYITSSDAEAGVTGWVAYADAAGTTPVDGTGGSPNYVELTAQATTVLRGSKSFKLLKNAANAQGEGYSYAFTIDKADVNKLLKISFDYNTDDVSGTAYAAGDFVVYIYDVTNGTLITPSNTSLAAWDKDNDGSLQYLASFSSTDSTSYRLCIHTASTSTGEYALYFDNVIVGPGSIVTGAAISGWESFTPTGTWSANTTWTGYKRRVGNSLEFQVQAALTGAPTGSFTLTIPDGLTIDSSAVVSTTAYDGYFGEIAILDSGTNFYQGKLVYGTSTSLYTLLYKADTTYVSGTTSVTATTPVTFASGDRVWLKGSIPIAEWAGSGTVNLLTSSTLTSNVKARMYLTGSQNVTNTSDDLLSGWTTSFDNGGLIGTDRITIPGDGIYRITMSGGTTSSGGLASDEMRFHAKLNGTTDIITVRIPPSISFASEERTTTLELSADDYIEVYCANNTGGTVGVNSGSTATYLEVVREADISSDGAIGFGLADSANAGLVKLNKWQTKYYDGTATSSATLITFNGLTAGKSYRFHAQAYSTAAGVSRVYIREGGSSNIIAVVGVSGSGDCSGQSGIFTATGTTAVMTWLSGTIVGNNGLSQTWMQLEELAGVDDTETTDFT